jgi:hypothetical protein
MRTFLVVLLATAALAPIAACGKKSEPTPEPTPSEPPTATDLAEPAEDIRKPPVTRTGQPITVIARLAEEAKSRPTGTPTVEDVFKALEGAGIKPKDPPKQFLAAQMLASFCKGGPTEGGLGISVCEYPDEEAARKGREYSLEKFKAANPNRIIVVNKKTTLTLITAAPIDSDVDAKRAAEIFQKL